MDYKEKYEEALERAKIWQEHLNEAGDKDFADELNYIFPELAESEDEKVRKHIIEVIKNHFSGEDADKCIAWLEKQRTSYTKRDVDEAYVEGMAFAKKELEKQGKPNQVSIWKHWKDGIAGNGEGKPIYLIKAGNTYNLSSCLGFECDYIELSELDNLMLEKKGKQKPTWSEEDDSMFQSCIGAVATNDYYKGEEKEQIYDWLKSLKQRLK